MSAATFAPWVEPIALRLEQSRRDIEQVAREIPEDAWENPSGYAGWSYKDQLSHVSESHVGLHSVLGAILAGQDPDFSRFLRIDEINEQNRQKHLETPVAELVASFTSASEETESILSGLSAEDADLSLGPLTLGQALQGFAMHDTSHLEELRKALPA